jgi:hypothetical protein
MLNECRDSVLWLRTGGGALVEAEHAGTVSGARSKGVSARTHTNRITNSQHTQSVCVCVCVCVYVPHGSSAELLGGAVAELHVEAGHVHVRVAQVHRSAHLLHCTVHQLQTHTQARC